MTTKLGWNDTNVFPYDLFHWVGIDGTPILSYLNHGVNEHTLPKDIHDHWQSYREKAAHPEHMLLYGHGDGGGGVTREMLEYVDRADLMVGQPASRYSTAAAFLQVLKQGSLHFRNGTAICTWNCIEARTRHTHATSGTIARQRSCIVKPSCGTHLLCRTWRRRRKLKSVRHCMRAGS